MNLPGETSDNLLLDLLRKQRSLTMGELMEQTGVTATAVRQRLTRLMARGLVERKATRGTRGRPGYRYSLTMAAREQAGNNFADLAMVLWQELRAVPDPQVRRGLLERLAKSLAERYREQFTSNDLETRMQQLVELFGKRQVPFSVEQSSDSRLPVLSALECPYPSLAEVDRGICSFEKMLFSELLGAPVRLSQCRLDGQPCCQFEPSPS